jgi:hypothetical protein
MFFKSVAGSIKKFVNSDDGVITTDWIILTAASVGLGLAAVINVRAGVASLGGEIESSLSNASIAALGRLGSVASVIEGNWRVAVVDGDFVENYNSTPWSFRADGTVFAGNLWSGTWQEEPDGSLAVSIASNAGDWTDEMILRVNADGTSFSGYRGDTEYRRAIRE